MIRRNSVSGAGLMLVASLANAIDLQPGDLAPNPAGMSLVQFAYGELERNDLYSKGARISTAPRIESQIYQLRFIHYTALAAMPAVFYVQQPWGNMHASGLPGGQQKANGYADTTFLLGVWPYSNRETNTHLAIGAYYYAATGTYTHTQSVNLGENRDKTALQAGFQTRLFDRMDWMLAFDATHFGTNEAHGTSKMRLTQKPLYTLQTGVNYALSPKSEVGLSVFHTYGGETALNGAARHDPTRLNRFLLTGTYRLPEYRSVLNLNYGRDLDTLNGTLETKRLVLRLTRAL